MTSVARRLAMVAGALAVGGTALFTGGSAFANDIPLAQRCEDQIKRQQNGDVTDHYTWKICRDTYPGFPWVNPNPKPRVFVPLPYPYPAPKPQFPDPRSQQCHDQQLRLQNGDKVSGATYYACFHVYAPAGETLPGT